MDGADGLKQPRDRGHAAVRRGLRKPSVVLATVEDVRLDEAPADACTTVVSDDAPAPLARRLAELGVRTGQQVTPLHRTAGGGRLVAVGDTRVALARSVLAGIEVEPA